MSAILKSLAIVAFSMFAVRAAAQLPDAPQAKVAESANSFAEARHLTEVGKYDEAITQLEAMQGQTPPPIGLWHELGIAYYKKSDYTNALLNFEKALKEDPADKEATQLMGICLYLAGHPGEAIPYLQKVLTWYPRANVDAAYILGTAPDVCQDVRFPC